MTKPKPDPDERTVRVNTRDLRRALTAVKPHIERRTAIAHVGLHRLRLTVDAPSTGTGPVWLRLFATNSDRTTAAAVVPLVDDSATGLFADVAGGGRTTGDIAPHDVDTILRAFDVHRRNHEDAGDEKLDLAFEAPATRDGTGRLFVEDVGGRRTGQLLRLPLLPGASDFPDVEAITLRALREVAGEAVPAREVFAPAHVYKAFSGVGDVYEAPISVRSIGAERGAGWLVRVGLRFVGTMPGELDTDATAKTRADEHTELLKRFDRDAARELAGATT